MKGTTSQTPNAGGLESNLPQDPRNAGELVNWTVDRTTGGWSSRVGYERYRPNILDKFDPYSSTGYIHSLHVAQDLAGGARQSILFEQAGNLSLVYESCGTVVVRTIRTGRHVPSATEAGSWFTDTAHGAVVTNGQDRPLLVRPWPLGTVVDSASTIARVARFLGFQGAPSPPEPYRVEPLASNTSSTMPGGGSLSLWCAANPGAIDYGGVWGLGFQNNAGPDPEWIAEHAWAYSYVTNTGSEGPLSPLGSTEWILPAGHHGFRYGVAMVIPTGPEGTVARKVYRTANTSADWIASGDMTLYEQGVIRNNVETLYFDAIRTNNLGPNAPVIPMVALPAPRARFSAIFGGCLFLDGGVEDALTLYYSDPGLIEQFPAANFLTLSGAGGGITAIFATYGNLLVFRENGIDVVQGDPGAFTITTISSGVTCRAPHSIQAVPGVGVVFLGLDGFYRIDGGLQGGAVTTVDSISPRILAMTGLATQDCLARAVSAYSTAESAYLCFVPTEGSDRPNLGYVLHTDKLGDALVSPWSTREGFPIGSMAVLHSGDVIFGHNVGAEAATQAVPTPEAGIFVLSSRRSLGGSIVTEGDVTKFQYGAPPKSTYKSAWMDFGDAQNQKQVQYVTLWVMTTGNPEITVRAYKDFGYTPINSRTYKAQPPDAAALPVFDTMKLNDGAAWSKERLVPIRVSVAQMSCAWFAFDIVTDEDIVLIGHEVEFVAKGLRVVAGQRA